MKRYSIEEAIDYCCILRDTFYGRLRVLKVEQRYQKNKTKNLKPIRYFILKDLKAVKAYKRPVKPIGPTPRTMARVETSAVSSGSIGIARNRENSYYMTIQPYERLNGFNAVAHTK